MNTAGKHIYILAGGGTGGHLYPAIAIGQGLLKADDGCEIHFIGTTRGIEARVIPSMGYPLHLIDVRGFSRKNMLVNIVVLARLFISFWQCFRILKKLKPAAVIGTGGYVSGPMLLMAVLLNYKTIIQEQNSFPGITTKWLAGKVNTVHLSFTESAALLKNKKNVHISGNPVRAFSSGMTVGEARSFFKLNPERRTVLVFGGSQGAMAINKVIAEALSTIFLNDDIQLIWITGKTGFQIVEKAVEPYKDRVFISEYVNNMEAAYKASNFAIARAGAITIAELAVCGVPSILIPYPYAAADHQSHNAEAFKHAGAAHVIYEKELSKQIIAEQIHTLLGDKEKMAEMSRAALAAAFPRATQTIVESVLKDI